MKAQVKALVAAPVETKYVSESLYQMTGGATPGAFISFSSAITGTSEIYSAIPRITQGLDDNNRIGNQICPRSVTVKLDICTATFGDNASRDRTVHVFLLTAKSVKSLDNYTAIPITQLLNKGDGTNGPFDGTQFTAQYPVNRSEFTVLKHKTMRMVKAFGITNGIAGIDVANTDNVITPSHQYAQISLKVKCPKTFKYDRASQRLPTNYAPFIVIGFTHNNDNTVAPNDFIRVLGQTQMRYTDE